MAIGDDITKGPDDPLGEYINTTINSNDVVIFSKTGCPPCKLAKDIFDKLNQPYTAVNIDTREDCFELQSRLGELTGSSTVPRVFVKGKSVGGAMEVRQMLSSGKLKKLLQLK